MGSTKALASLGAAVLAAALSESVLPARPNRRWIARLHQLGQWMAAFRSSGSDGKVDLLYPRDLTGGLHPSRSFFFRPFLAAPSVTAISVRRRGKKVPGSLRIFSPCVYVCARAMCVSDAPHFSLHKGMRGVA